MDRDLSPALIASAIAGDRRSVTVLIEVLTPIVQAKAARALCRRRFTSGSRDVRQEVADLTQSVFLALFSANTHALKQWDPARGLDFCGFVGMLAEREIASILRSRRRSPWTEEPTELEDLDSSTDLEIGPELTTGSRETLRAVIEKLHGRLSERGLELFYELLVEQRSVEEVCSTTGMTADAVYAWRSRLGRTVRSLAAEVLSETNPTSRTG
jgi:RNA polymerase sigma-70 factor (ECF subfamily)